MTANVMEGDEEVCRLAGMDAYITKPIDSTKLYQEIARQCHRNIDLYELSKTLSFPKIEGINSQQAIDRLGGNAHLYMRLLRKFSQEQQNFSNRYFLSIQEDSESAKRLCHTLKSVAAMLGMEHLTQLAHEAEIAIHPLPMNHPIFSKIEIEIERISILIDTLEDYPTENQTPSETSNPNKLKALLLKLQNSDATAFDDAFFLEQSDNIELKNAYDWIQKFEFDKAASLIRQTLQKEKL